MNNFISICEEDFKHIIMQAVILDVLFGNNNDNYKSSQEDSHNDFHEGNEN